MKIEVGVNVLVNRPGVENERGTVSKVIDLDDDTVVFVTLENEEVVKAFITDVTIIQEEKSEDKVVTISESKYREIALQAITEVAKEDRGIESFLTLFAVFLENRIFKDND